MRVIGTDAKPGYLASLPVIDGAGGKTQTSIAGLFSLATGLAEKSLIWRPVASAIVWSLAFSTVLTLFVIPLLYRIFMRKPQI